MNARSTLVATDRAAEATPGPGGGITPGPGPGGTTPGAAAGPRPTGPVYIGGPDRCGKTLLAAILGSHPRLAIPIVGSNLWTYFDGQFGDLRDDRNLDRCIDALLRYKHVAFLEPDADRLREDARRGPRTSAHVFALIHEQHARRLGKPRWGDQTGLVERYAPAIMAAHPDARMIHMVRDPRDRYEASLALWPKGRGRVGGATARWRYSMRLAEQNLRRYGPDRYRLVRYEDLAADPERIVREVCAFIGEAFEPDMLRMGDAPTFVVRLAAGRPVPEPPISLVTAEHIGGYRGAIPPAEIAFMERHVGGLMTRHGYRLDRPRLTGSARLRQVVLREPLDVGRMTGWLVAEAVQHRFPRLIGRTPIATKVLRS